MSAQAKKPYGIVPQIHMGDLAAVDVDSLWFGVVEWTLAKGKWSGQLVDITHGRNGRNAAISARAEARARHLDCANFMRRVTKDRDYIKRQYSLVRKRWTIVELDVGIKQGEQ